MKKKFTPKQINYLLLQMLAFTFICIMVFIDNYINMEFKYLKIGIYSFTIITVLVYEVLINLLYKKRKNYNKENKMTRELGNNERFLWFEILFLIDTLIIVAYVSVVTKIHVALLIVIGFTIFYIISMLIKPFFDIKHR